MMSSHEVKLPTYTSLAADMLPSPTSLGPPRMRSLTRRLLTFLTPSFLSRNNAPPEPTRPTDFLDGLRGYAAFIVFIHHFFMAVYPGWQYGYVDFTTSPIAQFPIIRLLFSGPPCVALFFVVSGFSISLKPLSLARSRSWPRFLDNLASATFRRTARLYVPSLLMLFISLVLHLAGAYDFVISHGPDWPLPRTGLKAPAYFPTARETVWDWIVLVARWMDPLPRKTGPNFIPYSTQVWTIPVELRCSLVCWVAVLALARARPGVRMACLGALAGYWHLQTNPDAPLFLAGVVLAEMFLVRQEGALLEKARLSDERLESPSTTSNARAESRNERMGNTAMFILALFFLGFPRRGADKAMFWGPWYTIAVWLVPDAQQFYLVTGAVLLVYSVSRSPSLQRLFTTELARYLGKISFALYLVHMAILLWFGYSSIELWWWVCGTETLWRWGLALAIAFLGQVVVVVWVADVFWRAVDAPSVRFARWIEERCKAES